MRMAMQAAKFRAYAPLSTVQLLKKQGRGDAHNAVRTRMDGVGIRFASAFFVPIKTDELVK
jgi:hypothetical protein